MARHRYTPRKGKDDISKKELAVREKPTKSGKAALAATKKSGDATASDGSLPPTLIGEDDTTLVRQEKFLLDPSMVYQPWQPPAKVLQKAKLLSSLGDDGEVGKRFEASLYQLSDLCPTPKVAV